MEINNVQYELYKCRKFLLVDLLKDNIEFERRQMEDINPVKYMAR